MGRIFYRGAYKQPREFNWVIGVVLLVLTLLMSFTGYLLPWDQLAFWAVTVGTEMAGYVPVIGNPVSNILLGGSQVGASTLLRFYVLHVALLAGHGPRVARRPPVALAQGLHARPGCEESPLRKPWGRHPPMANRW